MDVKLSDNSRRKLTAELTLTKAHLAMKEREGEISDLLLSTVMVD